MGDWFLDQNDRWVYDANAPSPSPGVATFAPRQSSGFVKPDGSAYDRPDPAQFNLFDCVDSRTIEDDGGPVAGPPDDAA